MRERERHSGNLRSSMGGSANGKVMGPPDLLRVPVKSAARFVRDKNSLVSLFGSFIHDVVDDDDDG